MTEPTTKEEAAAIAVLAKSKRLLVVVVPKGLPTESVMELKKEIDERLERLVELRGPFDA